jgi:hypothetical protein
MTTISRVRSRHCGGISCHCNSTCPRVGTQVWNPAVTSRKGSGRGRRLFRDRSINRGQETGNLGWRDNLGQRANRATSPEWAAPVSPIRTPVRALLPVGQPIRR